MLFEHKKHDVHTVNKCKIALKRDDDKRLIQKDRITTFARGFSLWRNDDWGGSDFADFDGRRLCKFALVHRVNIVPLVFKQHLLAWRRGKQEGVFAERKFRTKKKLKKLFCAFLNYQGQLYAPGLPVVIASRQAIQQRLQFNVLNVIDVASEYKASRPLRTRKASKVAEMFKDIYKKRSLRYPEELRVGNGTEFKSDVD